MSTSSTENKPHYAIIAGLFASSASFFGKLTGHDVVTNITFLNPIGFEKNIWIVRIICFVLMILCNTLVWTYFVKALHSTGGTLTATVTSAATNYFISFALGILVFGEHVTMLSVMGASLILMGLLFLTKDSNIEEYKSK